MDLETVLSDGFPLFLLQQIAKKNANVKIMGIYFVFTTSPPFSQISVNGLLFYHPAVWVAFHGNGGAENFFFLCLLRLLFSFEVLQNLEVKNNTINFFCKPQNRP
jgi:hypothetical protein